METPREASIRKQAEFSLFIFERDILTSKDALWAAKVMLHYSPNFWRADRCTPRGK